MIGLGDYSDEPVNPCKLISLVGVLELYDSYFIVHIIIFQGNHLAIGTHNGLVQIWDIAVSKKINQLPGHSARVGAAAWNGNILSTGSRDKMILLRDIRIPNPAESVCCVYTGHRQEVRCIYYAIYEISIVVFSDFLGGFPTIDFINLRKMK